MEVGKNTEKNKTTGEQRKQAKDDTSKVKPKAGVAPFLGRVTTVGER